MVTGELWNKIPNAKLLLILCYVGFVSLGLPDAVIGVAWPGLQDDFNLPQTGIGMILFATGFGYFISSSATGRLSQIMTVGTLLFVSTGLVALGLLGYSLLEFFPLFLCCGVLIGLGSGAIDGSLNHFVASRYPARHVNWLHAFYGVGATLGPAIMTAVIAGSKSWRAGYFYLHMAMLLLVVVFGMTRKTWDGGTHVDDSTQPRPRVFVHQTLRHPAVWLQVCMFFLYTGLEVVVGQWNFSLNTKARGLSVELAGTLNVIYWASLTAGRFAMGFIVDRLGATRLLHVAMSGTVLGSAVFAMFDSFVATCGLALIGFSLAPIFPTLMAITPTRFGDGLAPHVIGFQVSAAMLGAFVLPTFAGYLAERFHLETISLLAVALALTLSLFHIMLERKTVKTS